MLTGLQIKGARAMLGLDQVDLASAATVSRQTLRRIEAAPGPLSCQASTADRIQAALDRAGVEFLTGPDGAVGLMLRKVNVAANGAQHSDETSEKARINGARSWGQKLSRGWKT